MLLEVAVANGGCKLDCFDTVLPEIYGAHGFRAISRQHWDEQYAPDGWDKKLFDKYNHGEPDVAYMVYDPTYYGDYKRTDGILTDSYEDAVIMQDEAKDELTGTSPKAKDYWKNKTADREGLIPRRSGLSRYSSRRMRPPSSTRPGTSSWTS